MSLLDLPPVFAVVAQIQNARCQRYLWVTPDADLVIEGYPRSASTFLHRIIRAGAQRPIKIAQHVHRPQQITFAMRYAVPTVVLVRNPRDAIASHLVFNPSLTPTECVHRYISFSATVEEYLGHPRLRIVAFEDVIADPLAAARAIFDQLEIPHHVDGDLIATATADDRADRARSSLPNSEKDRLKQHQHVLLAAVAELDAATGIYWRLREAAWRF